MFLKPQQRRKDGQSFRYWTLVESVRTAKGPRQRIVSYLGELRETEQSGWAQLARSLTGHGQPHPELPFGGPSEPDEPVPEHIDVNVRKVRTERPRAFGQVYLALLLWRLLGLDRLLEKLLPTGREEVPWATVACILATARFCEPSSELHVAETWYATTALEDLLGLEPKDITKDRLYRAHDRLLPVKTQIESHLKERFATLFGAQYDLLLYDVTSTYFEGEAAANAQAQRGHSRDSRPDAKQVCIGLVVTREGFPVAYEVFEGNRSDVTTVREIVDGIEAKHGRTNRIWVVDRGMVNEQNLAYIRERNGSYIVGTPKSALRKHERDLLEQDWAEAEPGVEVRYCSNEASEQEAFVLCRSTARREKEMAMLRRFEQRIETSLQKLAERLETQKSPADRSQVERQIGRRLQQNTRAANLFEIHVDAAEQRPSKLQLRWRKREEARRWAELSAGCYLLRTNVRGWSAEELWRSYIQLTQAEAAFRTKKTDLRLRPVWHQQRDRVQAHILFSFLAYAMWKALEQWMEQSGLGTAPWPLLEQLRKLQATDVILPTTAGREIRLRCVHRPEAAEEQLLRRLGIELPRRLGEPTWADRAGM